MILRGAEIARAELVCIQLPRPGRLGQVGRVSGIGPLLRHVRKRGAFGSADVAGRVNIPFAVALPADFAAFLVKQEPQPNLATGERLTAIGVVEGHDGQAGLVDKDFAGALEVLVADYLQYILKYWVPRTRYCDKAVRNESTKGCDIIGIKLLNDCEVSPEDILAIFESKTQFSGRKARPRLQDAVIGSTKDQVRKAESLNAAKQVLLSRGKIEEVNKLERFQNPEDNPYREISGAAVLYSTYLYDPEVIAETTTRDHPNKDNLLLVVIRGDMTMKLIDDLYRRAADEA